MGFQFVGERVPELAGLPAKERRMRSVRAACKSYLYMRTWIGLVLFISMINYSDNLARAVYFFLDKTVFEEKTAVLGIRSLVMIASLFVLLGFQRSAIWRILRQEDALSLQADGSEAVHRAAKCS